jgi:hypothetical protein
MARLSTLGPGGGINFKDPKYLFPFVAASGDIANVSGTGASHDDGECRQQRVFVSRRDKGHQQDGCVFVATSRLVYTRHDGNAQAGI